MARQIKNNANYFTHDSDMRSDAKIIALRKKHGATGYAVWNFMLEELTNSENYEMLWDDVNCEVLSADFDVSPEELSTIIDYCVKIRLLTIMDGMLFSGRHKERMRVWMDARNAFIEKQKNNGMNGGRPRNINPTITQKNPTITQNNPTITQKNPTITQKNPTITQKNPTITQKNPIFGVENPLVTIGNLDILDINNNINNNNNNKGKEKKEEKEIDKEKEEKKDSGKEKKDSSDFSEFIAGFNRIRGSRFRAIDKVRRQFNARLKEGFTPAQMLQALESAMKDKYHIGEGYKFLTPEFFTRPDKIEKFINVNSSSPTSGQEKTHAPQLGADEWMRPDGTRTYGTGSTTVPPDAPPRPSASWWWNDGLKQWNM
ncbi:MAG: DUF4373 domain-containing protein [Tannerella sp.]|jgi:hypothetical protein|nr:DUF4373 domain-containing protein [Tannerella sp.]